MANLSRKTNRKEAAETPRPLVFISHDSRDAEIAEAFANLLSSISAGILKSFRSSDTKTRQGLDYGFEWFPQIESSLRGATDVICLLTERSLERPWILYEAGFARGNSNKLVLGLAIGIPLSRAVAGPFALLQNCDDDPSSLSKLLLQLLRRLPDAEPQEDAIRSNIDQFKQRVREVETSLNGQPVSRESSPDAGKLFEEIKAMFFDVSSEVKSRALNVYEAEHLVRRASGKPYDPIGIVILASALPPQLYWLQNLSFDLYRRLELGTLDDPERELKRLKYLLDISEPHFGESQQRRAALEYFGKFIDYIANSHSELDKPEQASGILPLA